MASEAILADIGALYKRLFDHRPIIQNEVHYFLKEFEVNQTKREDADFKVLQNSMSKADEVNNVFLNEIVCSNPHFKTIQDRAKVIQETCEVILCRDVSDLHISQDDQDKLDKDMQDYCGQLKENAEKVLSANDQAMAKLKEEIQNIRGARAKMRSIASSVSSGITIYPPGTPRSSPEDNEVVVGDEDPQKSDGGEGEEQLLGMERSGDQPLGSNGHQKDDEEENTSLELQSEQPQSE